MTAEQLTLDLEPEYDTQFGDVLRFLRENRTIEPIQALRELGVYRLAARIGDLRRLGYNITTDRVPFTSKYGRTGHYGKYTLNS